MEGKGGMMIKVLVSVQSEIVRLVNFELGLDEYMGICSSQSLVVVLLLILVEVLSSHYLGISDGLYFINNPLVSYLWQ